MPRLQENIYRSYQHGGFKIGDLLILIIISLSILSIALQTSNVI